MKSRTFLLLIIFLGYNTCLARLDAQINTADSSVNRIHLPVLLNNTPVYLVTAADSAQARIELNRVEKIIDTLRWYVREPERIKLHELQGAGIISLDSTDLLVVSARNRVFPELSPLANALALRNQILAAPQIYSPAVNWLEEEFLLRLLLGIIYPVSLLIVLRLVRRAIHDWERNWRKALLYWLRRVAEKRNLAEKQLQSQRIVNFVVGLERLFIYSTILILLSLIWFALFPQTQELAKLFLTIIVTPFIDLLGITAKSLLLIFYTLLVLFVAYRLIRFIRQKKYWSGKLAVLFHPELRFPLQVSVWILAFFLILFPYSGVPRLLAVGLIGLTLLAALIALRPLIEEIAAGIYLKSTYSFRVDSPVTVNGVAYTIVSTGLIHMQVRYGNEVHWLPYRFVLNADLIAAPR
jgi:small-conductance mechanosensitive channel